MLADRLSDDLKKAQLAREVLKVGTLRLLLSEIHNGQIAKGEKLSDGEIVSLVRREIKKRAESAAAFRKGSRVELAQKEEAEAEVLGQYLPPQLTEEELQKLVGEVVNEAGATALSDMGKVLGMIRSKAGTGVDMGKVSELVREKLSGE